MLISHQTLVYLQFWKFFHWIFPCLRWIATQNKWIWVSLCWNPDQFNPWINQTITLKPWSECASSDFWYEISTFLATYCLFEQSLKNSLTFWNRFWILLASMILLAAITNLLRMAFR
jgi:hypothetical protein